MIGGINEAVDTVNHLVCGKERSFPMTFVDKEMRVR